MIKSGGYRIGAQDIERACLELPYIAEAMVSGVTDEEYGQRVGAVLTLKQDARQNTTSEQRFLSIDRLRDDLRDKLPGYKLPTLMRVVQGELEKGPTGKVQKKVLGPRYFPVPGWEKDPQVEVWLGRKTSPKAKL